MPAKKMEKVDQGIKSKTMRSHFIYIFIKGTPPTIIWCYYPETFPLNCFLEILSIMLS